MPSGACRTSTPGSGIRLHLATPCCALSCSSWQLPVSTDLLQSRSTRSFPRWNLLRPPRGSCPSWLRCPVPVGLTACTLISAAAARLGRSRRVCLLLACLSSPDLCRACLVAGGAAPHWVIPMLCLQAGATTVSSVRPLRRRTTASCAASSLTPPTSASSGCCPRMLESWLPSVVYRMTLPGCMCRLTCMTPPIGPRGHMIAPGPPLDA